MINWHPLKLTCKGFECVSQFKTPLRIFVLSYVKPVEVNWDQRTVLRNEINQAFSVKIILLYLGSAETEPVIKVNEMIKKKKKKW